MRLKRLHIHHVRNLQNTELWTHERFNIFLGKNGSGKTSILEAIYLLALGRSFRTRQMPFVINHQAEQLTCYGEIIDEAESLFSLGIEKNRQGEGRCQIAGESCPRLSQYASMLPLQLITPETFKLLVAGPEERRKYLDWGVFHVEPSFGGLCQRYQRLLKQRNIQLKAESTRTAAFLAWETPLSEAGEQIAALREAHLQSLIPVIHNYIHKLLPGFQIDITVDRGWIAGQTLQALFAHSFKEDKRLGFTRYGPHRAELLFSSQGHPASQILSRGQQKLFICALYLAQAHFLNLKQGRKSIFVLDDLASELDSENRQRLLRELNEVGYQCFISDIEPKNWEEICSQYGGKMFHVEHGIISELDSKTHFCGANLRVINVD